MKRLPLLPHFYQKIGYGLFLPCLALGIAYIGWDFTISWLGYYRRLSPTTISLENFTDEVAAAGLMISMLLISFSKEKVEDEAIQFFRLASLQWAVLVNYIIIIFCTMFVYGGAFLSVMTYNMFTILFIFIIRFRYVLFQHNKAAA